MARNPDLPEGGFTADELNNLDDMVRALALMEQARDLNAPGDAARREHVLWEAGRIFESIGDDRGAAGAMVSLGRAYESTGRLDEAENAYQYATEVYREAELDREEAEAWLTLGRLQAARENLADSATSFIEGLTTSRHRGFGDLIGAFLVELAINDIRRGEHAEAGRYLDEAANVLGAAGDLAGRGRCLVYTGELLNDLGRYTDAESAYRMAVQDFIDASLDEAAADALGGLAGLLRRTDRLAEAAKVTEEAQALRERKRD